MPDNLKGKVAVITGSGQGIGSAIAIALAQEGASVVTNNRKKGSTGLTTFGESFDELMTKEEKERAAKLSGDAETVADEIIRRGGKAVPFFGDVGEFAVAGKLIQTAVDTFGKIDILVNNAGTFRHGYPWEMTEQDWDYVAGNKPKSYFNTIRHALPYMMEQHWGRIINCTSGAWLGQTRHPNYSAANAGVVGLTRSVARDVYKYGITCNAYAPGAVTRATISKIIADRLVKVATPIKDSALWQTERIAPMIAYLATDAAANVSGTVFRVHEGYIERYSDPRIVVSINKPEGLWTVDEIIKVAPNGLLEGYKSPVETA